MTVEQELLKNIRLNLQESNLYVMQNRGASASKFQQSALWDILQLLEKRVQPLPHHHKFWMSHSELRTSEAVFENPSSEDTEMPEDQKEQSSSISSSWLSPASPDGKLMSSLREDIWGWLNSLKIRGSEPGYYQVEVTVTHIGSTPTSKGIGRQSGTELPSEKARVPSLSGAHGMDARLESSSQAGPDPAEDASREGRE